MKTPENKGEENLDKYPILKKYRSIPDNLKPDDDHPDRKPVLTEKEEEQMSKEIIEKLWNPDGSLKKPLKKEKRAAFKVPAIVTKKQTQEEFIKRLSTLPNFYFLNTFEEAAIRHTSDGYYVKFKGEAEFKTTNESGLVTDGTLECKEITEKEYNNY